jgi:hypothetical protein
MRLCCECFVRFQCVWLCVRLCVCVCVCLFAEMRACACSMHSLGACVCVSPGKSPAPVRAYASGLRSIIDSRRGQANFQLIVITHEEDFVDMLNRHVEGGSGPSHGTSQYFRVFREGA